MSFDSRDDPRFHVPSYRINPAWPTAESPFPLPLFNPAISDVPEDALHWNDATIGELTVFSDAPPAEFFRVDLDLRAPLEPQLRSAREYALAAQHARMGKKVQRRRHPDKWLSYLRVLDARECGASWAEIERTLGLGGAHARAEKPELAARDAWNQARRLCFNF